MKRAAASRDELFAILETVMDPEVPVLSVVELGIVRDAVSTDDGALITITPTYSGCPAMREIETDIAEEETLAVHWERDLGKTSNLRSARSACTLTRTPCEERSSSDYGHGTWMF